MLLHLRLVVALAVGKLFVTLLEARDLVVVELDAQTGLVRNPYAAFVEPNAATGDDLVLFGLPGVVGVTGELEVGAGGGGVSTSRSGGSSTARTPDARATLWSTADRNHPIVATAAGLAFRKTVAVASTPSVG